MHIDGQVSFRAVYVQSKMSKTQQGGLSVPVCTVSTSVHSDVSVKNKCHSGKAVTRRTQGGIKIIQRRDNGDLL